MKRKYWKPVHPQSLQDAIRLTLEFALHHKNYSVPRVAELLGTSEWVVYKWKEKGSLPAEKILPLQHVCGATYITEYLASSERKLLIDIPTGARVDDADILALQTTFNESVNLLARFYHGEADVNETIASLTHVMSQIAGHRENVKKTLMPELSLFDGDHNG